MQYCLDVRMRLAPVRYIQAVPVMFVHADGERADSRSTRKQSCGAAHVLSAFCRCATLSARPASFTMAAPPTTSEWPLLYFVVECTTISIPRSSGFWKYGYKKVLSQIVINP